MKDNESDQKIFTLVKLEYIYFALIGCGAFSVDQTELD